MTILLAILAVLALIIVGLVCKFRSWRRRRVHEISVVLEEIEKKI